MTVDESKATCRALFLEHKAAGLVFHAVNRPYPVLLRLPTADELANGLETQEATSRANVDPDEVIVIRADADFKPVLMRTADGRTVIDQWATSLEVVPHNFAFEGELSSEVATRGTRKPGRPCAYIRLTKPLTLTWKRGEETWVAGSYMSCWDETKMDSFTSVTPESFAAMKQPAGAASARVFAALTTQS